MAKATPKAYLAVVALLTSLALACGPSPAPSDGDPGKGQQIYAKVGCNACHGDKGEGGKLLDAPKLAGTALSYEEVLKQVRTPRDKMPPLTASQISDEEVRHVLAWLKTLR